MMEKGKQGTIDHCRNCGEIVDKNFCPNCGQENKEYIISFKELLSDVFHEIFSIDSKLFRTLKFLIIKPGFLTQEYIAGKRASYISPLRLYLVISAIFFLTFSIRISMPSIAKFKISIPSIAEYGDNDRTASSVTDSIQVAIDSLTVVADSLKVADTDSVDLEAISDSSVTFNITPVDSLSGRYKVNFLGKEVEFSLKKTVENFVQNIPKMMFFLLPLGALLLNLMYIRRKRLYIEHLIFWIHIHTVLFLLLTLLQILPKSDAVDDILFLLSALYTFLAMKRFYQQSIRKTFIKLMFLSFNYLLMVAFFIALTFILTAIILVFMG